MVPIDVFGKRKVPVKAVMLVGTLTLVTNSLVVLIAIRRRETQRNSWMASHETHT